MKFVINGKIFQDFPDLKIALLVAKGIDNFGKNEEILKLLKKEQERIKEEFSTENLKDNPKIDSWRKAYKSFGAKPKKYRCSVENLYRMIISDIEVNHINKVVDIYNYISIKHTIPIGGDDIDHIDGNIELTKAKGNEDFKVLNSEEITHPKEGEVIYRDDKEVLCRRWNWRECNKSKMTEDSKNITLVIEGLPPVSKEEISKILEELNELIQRICGGETQTFILDKENTEINL